MTLDLLSCTSAGDQCAGGLTVFLILYGAVVIIALLAFVFNKELPNELKGFVFYAQVWLPHLCVLGTISIIVHPSMLNSFSCAGDWAGIPTIRCLADI